MIFGIAYRSLAGHYTSTYSAWQLRVATLALCAIALVTGSGGATAATVEYSYDANGRLTGVFTPAGEAAQYIYDPAGNIIQIKRFTSAQLAIIGFTPTSGPSGAQVTIYGAGFDPNPANDSVTFNGTAAAVSSATLNKLVATVPVAATTGPIGVAVGTNTAVSATNFVVTSGAGVPTITSFTPTIGVPGTSVAITAPISIRHRLLTTSRSTTRRRQHRLQRALRSAPRFPATPAPAASRFERRMGLRLVRQIFLFHSALSRRLT